MHRLAKLGFDQSYTYFTWRNTALRAARVPHRAHPRRGPPSTSARTCGRTRPTSCTRRCSTAGGRRSSPASCSQQGSVATTASTGPRSSSASTCRANRAARSTSHSEKYEIRHWDLDAPGSLRPPVSRVNRIRRAHPALQRRPNAACSTTSTTSSCSASRSARDDRADVVLVRREPRPAPRAVGLDRPRPRRARHPDRTSRSRSHDLLDRRALHVAGRAQLRRARPVGATPAHVLRGRRRRRGADEPSARDRPQPAPSADPTWYRDAVIYELHVRAVRATATATASATSRAHAASSTTCRTSASPRSGCCRSTRRRCATTATTSPTTATSTPPTARCADFRRFLREAHRRGLAGDHRAGAEPHVGPAPVVPAGPRARRRAAAWRDFYVWSDTPERYADARIIFQDFEPSNWTWDPVAGAVLLAPLLLAPARPQLRQPRRCAGRCSRVLDFWLEMGVDGLRLDAVPYLFEREGTNCENLPGDARLPAGAARARRRALRRPDAARRGQPVAGGRRRLLRRRRRVPHGVPLPADAAPVHGAADGGPLPDRRHPAADAGDPRRRASGRCSCATTTSSRSRW